MRAILEVAAGFLRQTDGVGVGERLLDLVLREAGHVHDLPHHLRHGLPGIDGDGVVRAVRVVEQCGHRIGGGHLALQAVGAGADRAGGLVGLEGALEGGLGLDDTLVDEAGPDVTARSPLSMVTSTWPVPGPG